MKTSIVSPGAVTALGTDISELRNEIGIVCTGNKCAVSASAGQFIILNSSTISGRADGVYKAAKAIPANTVLDSTYLTALPNGGMNELSSQLDALNSKIASLAPMGTVVDKNETFTCSSDAWQYTGVTISIPAGSEYSFRVECLYYNSGPTGVAVSASSSSHTSYETEVESNGGICSICGYTPNARTLYVWGKWASAALNAVTVHGYTRVIA